jgi:hypothetical protein
MKALKSTILTCLCTALFALTAFAHETPRSIDELLKDKVTQLIDHPDMSKLTGEKFNAEIEFIVTRQNQLIVLAVYTDNVFFDTYLKEKLNYRKVNLKGVQKMTPYRLNVNFIQP